MKGIKRKITVILERVHTHTHTHGVLLNKNVKKMSYIIALLTIQINMNKNRTNYIR